MSTTTIPSASISEPEFAARADEPKLAAPITEPELAEYARTGFHVVRSLFSAEEIGELRAFFDDVAERGEPIPGQWEPEPGATDSLRRFPRIMHPHTISDLVRERMLDPRIRAALTQLLGEEAVACQTMFYFKPPGARGQAFHQDNFYLRVAPASCIAAWVAVDASTPQNGGLQLCPGTHLIDVLCPEEADPDQSFTAEYVAPPPGHDPVKLWLEPGDVLFFTGSVVHGSQPNTTTDSWRKSFICHYMPASSTKIAGWYLPYMLDFDGNPISREQNEWGGPCGNETDNIARQFH